MIFLKNFLINFKTNQTLGELSLSNYWYEKSSDLDKTFKQAILKKHAVACHVKLEEYLESQHL